MVSGKEQFAADFELVQNAIVQYPSIKLVQTSGEPPEYYEVEYQVKGYTILPDKSIKISKKHQVSLTLPFGYPHFAPNVKPLTPLFHPDIDPGAIRIADFWQENKTLADLIIHIGQLITCETFNIDAPFNKDAAEYFEEHTDDLPLDTLKLSGPEEISPEKKSEDQATLNEELSLESNTEDVEFPESDDLEGLNFDDTDEIPSFEENSDQQISLEKESNKVSDALLVDIQKYFAKNKIFTANKLLVEQGQKLPPDERKELTDSIGKAIVNANDIYKEMEDFEDNGELREAKNCLDQLIQQAADYPDLAALSNRIRESLALANSLDLKKPKEKVPEVKANEKKSSKKKIATRKKITLPSIPLKLLVIVFIVLGLGAAGASLYLKDKQQLTAAKSSWLQSQSFHTQKKFTEAKLAAEDTLASLDSLMVFRAGGDSLRKEINNLLQNKEFIEAVEGRVLFEGKYIRASQAKMLTNFQAILSEGDAYLHEGKTELAIKSYEKALTFTQKNELGKMEIDIEQKINHLRLNQILTEAKSAEQTKNWENAANTYKRALELSKNIPDFNNQGAISDQLAAAQFRQGLTQSKETFAESQWQQTIEILSQAQDILQKNPSAISSREKAELEILQNNAAFYNILGKAKAAYEERNWEEAIGQYEVGLELLNKENANLGMELKASVSKINKTLLMVKISRELFHAAQAKEKKNLVTAISKYATVNRLIYESPFRENPNFIKIVKNTETQLKSTQKQLEIDTKIAWLTKNYKSIFKEHYPSARSSELLQPKITFVKKIEDRMIFNLLCTEKNTGRGARLELNYQYSSNTDKWMLFID